LGNLHKVFSLGTHSLSLFLKEKGLSAGGCIASLPPQRLKRNGLKKLLNQISMQKRVFKKFFQQKILSRKANSIELLFSYKSDCKWV